MVGGREGKRTGNHFLLIPQRGSSHIGIFLFALFSAVGTVARIVIALHQRMSKEDIFLAVVVVRIPLVVVLILVVLAEGFLDLLQFLLQFLLEGVLRVGFPRRMIVSGRGSGCSIHHGREGGSGTAVAYAANGAGADSLAFGASFGPIFLGIFYQVLVIHRTVAHYTRHTISDG